jgi:hypothetical protein
MLRDCRICGPVGLTVCVCAIGGEAARSMVEPVEVKLFTTYKSGDDQAHTHDEPTAPPPTAAVIIRASSTATIGLPQLDWAVIPSSIAPPPLLFWRTPPWPVA